MTLIDSARNRVRNIVNKDKFSWLDKDRASHLRLRDYLTHRYPMTGELEQLGNYAFPTALFPILRKHPLAISGGVEFHIDFEVELSKIVPMQFHFFEVDARSIEWFRGKYSDRSDFLINHLGLSSKVEQLDVLGDMKCAWSSTVDQNLAASSKRHWGVIGKVQTTTVGQYCAQREISEIGMMKLDIEGFATRVIHSSWDDRIMPKVLVFEVERGATENIFDYSDRLFSLLKRAEDLEYVTWHVPRTDGYSSFSTDFILVRANALQSS